MCTPFLAPSPQIEGQDAPQRARAAVVGALFEEVGRHAVALARLLEQDLGLDRWWRRSQEPLTARDGRPIPWARDPSLHGSAEGRAGSAEAAASASLSPEEEDVEAAVRDLEVVDEIGDRVTFVMAAFQSYFRRVAAAVGLGDWFGVGRLRGPLLELEQEWTAKYMCLERFYLRSSLDRVRASEGGVCETVLWFAPLDPELAPRPPSLFRSVHGNRITRSRGGRFDGCRILGG